MHRFLDTSNGKKKYLIINQTNEERLLTPEEEKNPLTTALNGMAPDRYLIYRAAREHDIS